MKQQTDSLCANNEGICALDEWMRELTWWEKLTIPFYRAGYFLQSLFARFKWRYQRFLRGYACADVWDMDRWFIRTVKPMLQNLLEHHNGYPSELTDEEWNAILQEMISCIGLMDEDSAKIHLGVSKDDFGSQSYELVYKCMYDNKQRFFELFERWFYCLWD